MGFVQIVWGREGETPHGVGDILSITPSHIPREVSREQSRAGVSGSFPLPRGW